MVWGELALQTRTPPSGLGGNVGVEQSLEGPESAGSAVRFKQERENYALGRSLARGRSMDLGSGREDRAGREGDAPHLQGAHRRWIKTGSGREVLIRL